MTAPSQLSSDGRTLWSQITANFTLETTEIELLRLALEALDRASKHDRSSPKKAAWRGMGGRAWCAAAAASFDAWRRPYEAGLGRGAAPLLAAHDVRLQSGTRHPGYGASARSRLAEPGFRAGCRAPSFGGSRWIWVTPA
jgi:hypothetical protein